MDRENALINCAHPRQAVLVGVVVPKMTCQDATQARNARQHKESAKDSNHGLVPFDATATALTLYTFRVDMILRPSHSATSRNPEQYLTTNKGILDSAAAVLIREITQQRPLN